MALLERGNLLVVAAVTEIALHTRIRPLSSKALAARYHLPLRHLERVLQALAREGILKGTRGRRGGYRLARHRREITAAEILRVARRSEDAADPCPEPTELSNVVGRALDQAENAFAAALAYISIEDLTRSAAAMGSANGRGRSMETSPIRQPRPALDSRQQSERSPHPSHRLRRGEMLP
jgi:Rrf2 family protein